nr:CapA family protein [Alkalilimnicola ehrlichii]
MEHSATLFLAGDVMTGRGIDQVLPHSVDPRIYEPVMDSAEGYVALAERANGPIPRPVDYAYVWGDALAELRAWAPAPRLINLETAVTTCDDPEPKGIHYRMHPGNVPLLQAAGVDGCVLANNHVLDWGRAGLLETLEALDRAGIRYVGAGRDRREAAAPTVFGVPGGRLVLYALGMPSSGVPAAWAATEEQPGVNVLPRPSDEAVTLLAEAVRRERRPGDVVAVSLHWGSNWGYAIPRAHRVFAHALIDRAGVDLVWGHSSHHVRGIEVYKDRLILYGCGDFLNDYEGIGGHEAFRGDLVLMYLPALALADGRLRALTLVPLQIRNFRLHRAKRADAEWLAAVLDREGRALGTSVTVSADGRLALHWR